MNEVEYDASREMAETGRAMMEELAEYFCEFPPDVARFSRRLYKSTDCGAWLALDEDGLKVGSIVEGADVDCETHLLTWGEYMDMDEGDLAKWLDRHVGEIEAEAAVLWDEWNLCPDCGKWACECTA